MRKHLLAVALTVAVLETAALAQTVNMRPGKYEVTMEMAVAEFPVAPQKDTDCVTARDLKNLPALFVRDVEEQCKTSDVKLTDSTLTFNSTCDVEGVRYTSMFELTFAPESYSGVMRMKTQDENVMTVKLNAQRIGECGK